MTRFTVLGLARKHGELSRSEHRLINAVFEFDDTVVVDEYGTNIGCATLEDVIEQIVGPVEDEFDTEPLEVVQDGLGKYIVSGGALIAVVNRQLNLNLAGVEAETLSGLLMENTSRVLIAGDRIELNGAVATVLELKGSRASSILMEV